MMWSSSPLGNSGKTPPAAVRNRLREALAEPPANHDATAALPQGETGEVQHG
jgi:hypothetical protein